MALNRKNALFAGHDTGAENWAVIASLIETCKMNGIDPQAWLTATLTASSKAISRARSTTCSRGTTTPTCERNTAYDSTANTYCNPHHVH